MKKTKETVKAAPAKKNRTGVGVGLYLPGALVEALDRAIEESRPRSNKTAIIEMLLEEWLAGKGLWPPAGGLTGEARA
jgi:hypothetical protein